MTREYESISSNPDDLNRSLSYIRTLPIVYCSRSIAVNLSPVNLPPDQTDSDQNLEWEESRPEWFAIVEDY